MTGASLLELLESLLRLPRETAWLEFKRNWDQPEDIGQYLSALANAAALERKDRAWMVWGVDNASHEVTGTSFNPFTAKGEGNQALVMWLTQSTSPRPDFQFHEVKHPRGSVVMLEIHPPRVAPLAFRGVRYIRIDSHKTRLSEHPDREARLWEALGGAEDWTGQVIAGAGIDVLDPEAVAFARSKFTEYLVKNEPEPNRHEKIRQDAAKWDTATLLNKARLTKGGAVTRSALLLLGRDESAHFLAPADAKISWVLRDATNRTIDSRHFGPPLLLSTEAWFRRIRNVTVEYMPDGTLFPTPITQYDPWVIREALHNCIAHQDYHLGGKINTVEYPDRLVFSNLGAFIPPSIEWMLDHQSPPEHYRNQWLIEGMVRLRMIDQVGSGIRRMFETQRERFFPLPDYTIDPDSSGMPRVEVAISCKILDMKYTHALMRRSDLDLRQVMLLDRVQKGQEISREDAQRLKAEKLIEGRAPKYFISAKVAAWAAQKARYIHNRGLDDEYYRRLVIEYLQRYGEATRQEIGELVLPKLSEVLDPGQKSTKVRNMLQSLRRTGKIRNKGSRASPVWVLEDQGAFTRKPGK